MSLVLLVAAAAAGLAGCGWLALGQDRHRSRVPGAAVHRANTLRRRGAVALVLSLALCVVRDGPSFALLLWPPLFGLGSLAVTAALAWRPSLLHPLARVGRRHT